MKRIGVPYAEIRIKLKLITENIRRLRESRSYSQEYMAGRLFISQNTYSKLELGYTALTIERLIMIAAILEVDAIQLISPAEEPGTDRQTLSNHDVMFQQAPL
jgi:transcriptional regulator with XRE-family HTH domain